MFTRHLNRDKTLDKIFFISEQLVTFEGLEDVFSYIVQTAVSLIHGDAATIRVFDFTTGKLKIVKAYGLSKGFLEQPAIKLGEGITGQVVLQGKSFMCEDVMNDPHCITKELAKLEGISSLISIPLKTREKCIGALNVYSKGKGIFATQDMLMLNLFGLQAAQAIEKANLFHELTKQSAYDFLTDAYNKKAILVAIEKSLSLSLRHSFETSIIFIDIDNFKAFNDTHGHILGDKLLCDFAKILIKYCRKADAFGRFGGEEFIMMAPHINKSNALILANKLMDAVAKHNFVGKNDEKVHVTFSAGIATFPSDGTEASVLIEKADAAMYQSKKAGKNRVTVWSEK